MAVTRGEVTCKAILLQSYLKPSLATSIYVMGAAQPVESWWDNGMWGLGSKGGLDVTSGQELWGFSTLVVVKVQ